MNGPLDAIQMQAEKYINLLNVTNLVTQDSLGAKRKKVAHTCVTLLGNETRIKSLASPAFFAPLQLCTVSLCKCRIKLFVADGSIVGAHVCTLLRCAS